MICIRLPNDDFIEISRSAIRTVVDLKNFIVHSGCLYHDSMQLLYNNGHLEDVSSFADGDVQVEVILALKPRVKEVELNYETFLESTYPESGATGVDLNVRICINFKRSLVGYMLFLPSLEGSSIEACSKDDDTVDCALSEHPSEDVSSSTRLCLTNECNSNETISKHDKIKVFLLEIPKEEEKTWAEICGAAYKWPGIDNGYTRGDPSSWKRYTSEPPIPCEISTVFAEMIDTDGLSTMSMSLVLQQQSSLSPVSFIFIFYCALI